MNGDLSIENDCVFNFSSKQHAVSAIFDEMSTNKYRQVRGTVLGDLGRVESDPVKTGTLGYYGLP